MKQIFLIDPIDRLVLHKDSSLFLALTMQKLGADVYLLFKNDFYWSTLHKNQTWRVYKFSGIIKEDFFLRDIKIKQGEEIVLDHNTTLHMRLDPPIDQSYITILQIERHLTDLGVSIINNPKEVLAFNEKIGVLSYPDYAIPTYLGTNYSMLEKFLLEWKNSDYQQVVFKPLNECSGVGVEKYELDIGKIKKIFLQKVEDSNSPIIVQPFLKEIYRGEVRATFFNGIEIGNILKVPSKDDFRTNLNRGSSYHKIALTNSQKEICQRVTSDLMKNGVLWVAFDLIGNYITEINITSPGLLVETSNAYQQNLAETIINKHSY